MFDANNFLGQLLNSPGKQGFAGGLAGGVVSNLLVSKAGRKVGKLAMRYGAVAAVGALAYGAWQKHRAATGAGGGQVVTATVDPPAVPRQSGFLPPAEDEAAAAGLGVTLVRAMIAAARADGKLDVKESSTILTRLEQSELDAETKGTLINELSHPVSVDTLVASVESPQQAMEVYLASLMAIEVDSPAERAYLTMLAARLGLEQGLVDSLHAQVEKL